MWKRDWEYPERRAQAAGCAGHWFGEHWGWPGVQLGYVTAGSLEASFLPLQWFENTTTELALELSLPARNTQQQMAGGCPGRERSSLLLVSLAWQHSFCSERMQWLQLTAQLTLEEKAPNKA